MIKKDILINVAKSNSLAKNWLGQLYHFITKTRPPRPPGTWSWFAVSDELWFEILRDQERWYAKRQLEKLKERNFLKKQEQGSKIIYELTEQGQALILQEIISETKELLPKNEKCFVIFDIPEPARDTRDLLRRILKKCNFSMVQQSVWASRYKVEGMLLELFKITGIDKWTKVFIGRPII